LKEEVIEVLLLPDIWNPDIYLILVYLELYTVDR